MAPFITFGCVTRLSTIELNNLAVGRASPTNLYYIGSRMGQKRINHLHNHLYAAKISLRNQESFLLLLGPKIFDVPMLAPIPVGTIRTDE